MESAAQRPAGDDDAHGMMMLAVSWLGGEDMVQALVQEDGVSVDAPDAERRTPLMLVPEEGAADAARWLIDLGADVNATNKRGTTPLMYAAKRGRLDIVELLVDAGADVNASNDSGLTPLACATIHRGNTHVVRYLVDAGADLNAAPFDGVPILMRLIGNEEPEIVRYAIDAGADVNAANKEGTTPVMLAAVSRDLDLVQRFVGAGADTNAADSTGQTPLMFAAQGGSLDVARCLVEADAEVDGVADDGGTPLLCAAAHNNMNIVRYLTAVGADVNAAQNDGLTALMLAAQRDLSDVRCILDAGANVNAVNGNGWTPLLYAAMTNKLDVVRCLVGAGADVNLAATNGFTPLMEAAVRTNLGMMRYLVDAGADVNATREGGETALIDAAPRMNLDGARCLVDAGADVNATEANGQTPLSRAAIGNSIDVVRFLVESGANLNPLAVGVSTPLMSAVKGGDLDMVKFLVDSGADVNAVDQSGATALMYAAMMMNMSSDVVAYLIDAGADVNAIADGGWTTLMCAADCYQVNTIGQLVDAGADVNAACGEGRTALMDAAERGKRNVVQCLIKCGADASQADRHGHTALFFAAKHGHLAIQHLLARHIVRSRDIALYVDGLLPTPPQWTTMSWLIPPFEVALLTAGGTGEYRAKWLDADVILKLFIPGASPTTFKEQVAVWHQLRHPNVIKLYGACNVGHHFFVCEFASNGTLAEYLAACDRSGARRTPWKFLYKTALGLTYLHERQIVHGNLRPSKILVGSDMLAKLSDFGMSGTTATTSGVFGQERWHSPEQLKGGKASFASDVYSLGLCIFEVVTGAVPWASGEFLFFGKDGRDWDPSTRPDVGAPGPLTDDDVRFLMARMCGQDPQTRVETSVVVRLLECLAAKEGAEDRPSQPEPEPLLKAEEYKDGKLSRVWSKLSLLVSQGALQDLPLFILHDLEAVYEQLRGSRQSWTTLQQFHSLLDDFERAVAVGSHQNRILRLSSTRATSGSMEIFRRRIDSMWMILDGSDPTKHRQEARWEEQRKRQMEVFVSEVSRTLLVMNELTSEEDRIAFLTLLKGEIDAHRADYSEAQLAVMQKAYDDMAQQAGSDVLMTMPPWFLPWYELMIDNANWLGDGGFGSVYRAKWLDSEVVVKQVKMLGVSNSSFFSDATTVTSDSAHIDKATSERGDDTEKQKMRRMFEREVDIWFSLSHPHVVRLFGACHVGTPFFACEYASNGSLDKYLRTRPDEIWRKLYETALGIQYLHARGVIHGDLKCNNIVVGSDGLAKVTDFGLSSSAALTGKEDAELTGAWHWVAPECLERGASEQTTASDVYAFGMCIVEALRVVEITTVKKSDRAYVPLPWGSMDNAVVKHYVVREQKLPLRPEMCSDAQWTLVARMCAHDPADRLMISTVVDELTKLAGVHTPDEADEVFNAPATAPQPIPTVIADMKRCCHQRDDASSSDQEVWWKIYGLLWDRLEHLVNKDRGGVESLLQLIERAASITTGLQNAGDTLVQFTENALRGYALHRDLDKLIDANRWRFDGDEARVHDWKGECYDFLGVTGGDVCLETARVDQSC